QMLKLEHPPFVAYGRAFCLIVNALAGSVDEPHEWLETIDQLERFGHSQFANALRWHAGIYLEDHQSLSHQARAALIEQGCVSPEKLVDVIIPLPSKAKR
ncbi:MAG: hypothetical protein NXI32_03540, partial [bacterium]|nr:hypothetical protein [bacterium]